MTIINDPRGDVIASKFVPETRTARLAVGAAHGHADDLGTQANSGLGSA
jgi:hypothetical protein